MNNARYQNVYNTAFLPELTGRYVTLTHARICLSVLTRLCS